ncbi:DNA phosphorothioation-dependent restriction protein DptF [Fundicoccus sp. Sow4_H7]|uniref:DNA phosphorothioation-dependent restriction protein DptF n=1 Tax=Fundicoccus sp. Sow4_H7 TaxID=3438784 RepID=UPI003F9006AD
MNENYKNKYLNLAQELHQLLIEKYKLNQNSFSKDNLSVNAFNLKRKNLASYDRINKILNVSRTMSNYIISENEYEELEDLHHRIKRSNNGESELEEVFSKLSIQSKDAIINENDFDEFKEYMHIYRPIEERFIDRLFEHLIPKKKSVLFLVGNVGDGKSHLLSRFSKKYKNEFVNNRIIIHNDATETDSPQKTSIQTLLDLLEEFSDDKLYEQTEKRLIIAINLGVLTNLVSHMKVTQKFNQLVEYIEATNITSNYEKKNIHHPVFDLISFREDSNFEYTDDNLNSQFYAEALQKVFSVSKENPFYVAYSNDYQNGIETILHYNYQFMLRKDIQRAIVYLLIRAEVEYKAIISTRDLFNLFYEICHPRDDRSSYDSYLPFLLFDNASKSSLLYIMNLFDPAKSQTRKIDEIAIQLYHATDTYSEVLKLLGSERDKFRIIFESFKSQEDRFDDFFNTLLRIKYLINHQDTLFNNNVFDDYLDVYHNIKKNRNYRELLLLIIRSMGSWYGESPVEKHVVRETSNNNVKLLLEITLKPKQPYTQGGAVLFPFVIGNKETILEIDFQVYKVLRKVVTVKYKWTETLNKNGHFR